MRTILALAATTFALAAHAQSAAPATEKATVAGGCVPVLKGEVEL